MKNLEKAKEYIINDIYFEEDFDKEIDRINKLMESIEWLIEQGKEIQASEFSSDHVEAALKKVEDYYNIKSEDLVKLSKQEPINLEYDSYETFEIPYGNAKVEIRGRFPSDDQYGKFLGSIWGMFLVGITYADNIEAVGLNFTDSTLKKIGLELGRYYKKELMPAIGKILNDM